jgi:hypothetical protein
LPVVLYGYETLTLTVGEEHRLKLSENRVLRRISGPKREEVAGGWRLHNEKFHNFYTSTNIIRVIKPRRLRWAGHVARLEDMRKAYNISVGKPEGKRPLGRRRDRWEDNTRLELWETGWNGVNWLHLPQDWDQW